MLCKWTALRRFPRFPTINSVLSNAGEFRRQSRHVVGVPMLNRRPMTGRDGASELPHSNEGAINLRVVHLARQRPEGVRRRLPDDRMLKKGPALMRFTSFPTINTLLSISGEFRRHSRHVVGVPLQYRPTMTGRDGASELMHSNERCDHSQCGTPRMTMARGPSVADFKDGSPTELQRFGVTEV
jgi:hypothetical protein